MMVGVMSSVSTSILPRWSMSVAVLASTTEVTTIFASLGLGPQNLGFGTKVMMPWSRSIDCGMKGPDTATLLRGCHHSCFSLPSGPRACEILTGAIRALEMR